MKIFTFDRDRWFSGLLLFGTFFLTNAFFRAAFIFPIDWRHLYHWRIGFKGLMHDVVAAGVFYVVFALIFLFLKGKALRRVVLVLFLVAWGSLNYVNYQFALSHDELLPLFFFDEFSNYREDAANLGAIVSQFLNLEILAHLLVPPFLTLILTRVYPPFLERNVLPALWVVFPVSVLANTVINHPSVIRMHEDPRQSHVFWYWYVENQHRTPYEKENVLLPELDETLAGILFDGGEERPALPRTETENPNVVLIQLESMRAFELGVYGGDLNLSPYFDRLARKGVLFREVYSTDFLTKTGQFAVFCGGLMNEGGAPLTRHRDHPRKCLGDYLGKRGYEMWWFHGQSGTYDYQGYFFRRQGFRHLMERLTFPHDAETMGWGISDEALFRHVSDHLDEMTEPFLLVAQTQTNHAPFKAPERFYRNLGFSEETNKHLSTVKYTDETMGRFLEGFLETERGRRSLVVVYADHGIAKPLSSNVNEKRHEVLQKYRVPVLVIYPEKERGGLPETVDALGNLGDVYPTLLDILGIRAEHPVLAKSLIRKYPHRFNLGSTKGTWLYNGEKLFFGNGEIFDATGALAIAENNDEAWFRLMDVLPKIEHWTLTRENAGEIRRGLESYRVSR